MFHPNQDGYDYYSSQVQDKLEELGLGTISTTTTSTTSTTLGTCGLVQVGQACNSGLPSNLQGTTTTSTTTSSTSTTTTTTTPPAPRSVTRNVAVGAASAWVDTGIAVRAGDYDSMVASGSWFPGSPANASFGPDGTKQLWQDNYFNLDDIGVCQYCATTATSHWGALIGYIGVDPPPPGSYSNPNVIDEAKQIFLVGASYPGRAASSGELWLAMNDAAYSANLSDNTGQVDVVVAVVAQS
jgi:hypothetical protein